MSKDSFRPQAIRTEVLVRAHLYQPRELDNTVRLALQEASEVKCTIIQVLMAYSSQS